MFYNCSNKKVPGGGLKSKNMANQEKIGKPKVHPSFIENIWGADLEDIHLISKSNERLISLCYLCFR